MSGCVACGQGSRTVDVYRNLDDYEYGMSGPRPALVRCAECSLMSLSPMPGQEELKDIYPAEYCNVHEESSSLHKFLVGRYYDTLLTLFDRVLPKEPRILDVGCAAGHFLGYAGTKRPNWRLSGVDLNPEAVAMARSKGRDVRQAVFEEADFTPGSFDAVILSHFIEHVVDPGRMLDKAKILLTDQGLLYLETPNIDCLDFRLFGRYWGGLHYPRHTYLFSPSTIRRLLSRHKFDRVEVSSTLNMFGWALSLSELPSG